ncbi:MAG: hypothetical protein ABIJ09_25660 [Pseudomonadota bacterium]
MKTKLLVAALLMQVLFFAGCQLCIPLSSTCLSCGLSLCGLPSLLVRQEQPLQSKEDDLRMASMPVEDAPEVVGAMCY